MCAILQKIEVDPVKFAAELESYEDLKRRLVVDAALFGAVGAFATFQVRLSFFVDGFDLSHTNLESSCSSKQRAETAPFGERRRAVGEVENC